MEFIRSDQGGPDLHYTSVECRSFSHTKKEKTDEISQPHVEVVKEVVKKLKQVRAIKEVFFPKWLANTMMVKKKNGKLRACVCKVVIYNYVFCWLYSVPKLIVISFNLLYHVFIVGFHCKGYVIERECEDSSY